MCYANYFIKIKIRYMIEKLSNMFLISFSAINARNMKANVMEELPFGKSTEKDPQPLCVRSVKGIIHILVPLIQTLANLTAKFMQNFVRDKKNRY